MDRIPFLLKSLETTRGYTNMVLDRVPESDWFKQPCGVTHVAWQVGHLAVAEYFLTLERMRGAQPGDEELISQEFRKQTDAHRFPIPPRPTTRRRRNSEPVLTACTSVPSKKCRILTTMNLDKLCDGNHPMFKDKFGSLCWFAQHEFSHAGQLSLIRRLLGSDFAW